jgi:hypothetical protein
MLPGQLSFGITLTFGAIAFNLPKIFDPIICPG